MEAPPPPTRRNVRRIQGGEGRHVNSPIYWRQKFLSSMSAVPLFQKNEKHEKPFDWKYRTTKNCLYFFSSYLSCSLFASNCGKIPSCKSLSVGHQCRRERTPLGGGIFLLFQTDDDFLEDLLSSSSPSSLLRLGEVVEIRRMKMRSLEIWIQPIF